jgi:bis(5'-adenosyl)-triphosphatase
MQNRNSNDCPFCAREIGEVSFTGSENFLAIYNKAPILPGHSLIIPKMHVASVMDLTAAGRSEMMELSMDAIEILGKVFGSKSFDWTIQEGTEAGQSIQHLHLHLIPRKEKDLPDPGDWYPLLEKAAEEKHIESENRSKLSFNQMKEIVNNIKKIANS